MKNNYIPNKISILLPTRLRPIQVSKTIDNIISKVSDIENLEILLRMDEDDTETLELLKTKYCNYIDKYIKIVVGERKKGYEDLSNFFYELFEISTGEWMFLFNDDLTCETQNFDLLITENNYGVSILYGLGDNFNCNIRGGNWCFPIVNRKIVQTLEHFSIETPHVDGWIRLIGESLNLIKIVPIKLNHSVELLNHLDSVNSEKNLVLQKLRNTFNWDFHHNEGLIYQDILKLKKTLLL